MDLTDFMLLGFDVEAYLIGARIICGEDLSVEQRLYCSLLVLILSTSGSNLKIVKHGLSANWSLHKALEHPSCQSL